MRAKRLCFMCTKSGERVTVMQRVPLFTSWNVTRLKKRKFAKVLYEDKCEKCFAQFSATVLQIDAYEISKKNK